MNMTKTTLIMIIALVAMVNFVSVEGKLGEGKLGEGKLVEGKLIEGGDVEGEVGQTGM